MKRLLLLLLIIPMAMAEEVELNTTIGIDWVGSDKFYIRTEDIDKLYDCNSQNDSEFNITITNEVDLKYYSNVTDYNCTNQTIYYGNLLLDRFDNFSEKIFDNANCSHDYASESAAHERMVVLRDEARVDRDYYKSESENETIKFDAMENDKDGYKGLYDEKDKELYNCTMQKQLLKKKADNSIYWALAAAVLAAGIVWWIYEGSKKIHERSGVARDGGHSTFETKEKQDWPKDKPLIKDIPAQADELQSPKPP